MSDISTPASVPSGVSTPIASFTATPEPGTTPRHTGLSVDLQLARIRSVPPPTLDPPSPASLVDTVRKALLFCFNGASVARVTTVLGTALSAPHTLKFGDIELLMQHVAKPTDAHLGDCTIDYTCPMRGKQKLIVHKSSMRSAGAREVAAESDVLKVVEQMAEMQHKLVSLTVTAIIAAQEAAVYNQFRRRLEYNAHNAANIKAAIAEKRTQLKRKYEQELEEFKGKRSRHASTDDGDSDYSGSDDEDSDGDGEPDTWEITVSAPHEESCTIEVGLTETGAGLKQLIADTYVHDNDQQRAFRVRKMRLLVNGQHVRDDQAISEQEGFSDKCAVDIMYEQTGGGDGDSGDEDPVGGDGDSGDEDPVVEALFQALADRIVAYQEQLMHQPPPNPDPFLNPRRIEPNNHVCQLCDTPHSGADFDIGALGVRDAYPYPVTVCCESCYLTRVIPTNSSVAHWVAHVKPTLSLPADHIVVCVERLNPHRIFFFPIARGNIGDALQGECLSDFIHRIEAMPSGTVVFV
jgi:hypothetical protein